MVGSQHQRLDHCIRHAHAAHSVAFALPVLLLIRFQNIPKDSKMFSVSEKNRPPGDPLGGPKSLLEAKKSLAELKIEGSKAFLAPHARN